jgi:signal peptidase II
VFLLVVVVIGTAIDLASKTIAFNTLADAPVGIDRAEVVNATELQALIPRHEPTTIVPSVLDLQLVLNPGAVFGIGAGKRVFFIIATTAAIAFALFMFARWTGRRDRVAHAAIGLVIAGGLGNLYDRVRFACVRDFLHPLPNVRYPFGISTPWSGNEIWPYVSNLADLWLIIGVAVLVVYLWRGPREVAGG